MKSKGCEVAYYDPYIPEIRLTREHGHWAGTKCVAWDQKTVSGFDAVLIATAHANVDYVQLGQWAKLIVDTRNAMMNVQTTGVIIKA
jgi:UDP-N-acetyl-D-glucosamine dehydrogenase